MIIPLPSRPLALDPAAAYDLPQEVCCNCGVGANLSTISQDTRLTRYWLAGGSERTLRLDLPFCADCAVTATRRPLGALHVFLVAVLAYSVVFGAGLVLGLVGDSQQVLEQTPWVSLLAAPFLTALFYAGRRRRAGQSSWYQPVRLLDLSERRGTIVGIRLGFTSPIYARAFRARNDRGIATGAVVVREL